VKATVLACSVVFSFALSACSQDLAGQVRVPHNQSFDPSVPLTARVQSTPSDVWQNFTASTTHHDLTKEERARLEGVLTQLPAFSRSVLLQHVRSISFVDGIPSNGLTSKESDPGMHVFNIVLRAGLLNEDISEFLTRKERSYYNDSDDGFNLSVEAGSLPALLYVLVHESVHVLDISNRRGTEGPPMLFADGRPDLLVRGIWKDVGTKESIYDSKELQKIWFGYGWRGSLESSEAAYRMLAETPFSSLYGSSNWYDDTAELVTCYYLTQELHQPYRIVLGKASHPLYSLKPMDSVLVRERFSTIEPLFTQPDEKKTNVHKSS
jgi:hypothetical protein